MKPYVGVYKRKEIFSFVLSERYQLDEQRWRQLMIDSQQGNESSYEQLLIEIGDATEIYLKVRFGNLDILEDCVQECLIAIHQARHTYNPKRSFRPWMFTIVRHRAIDILRQRNCRIQTTELTDENDVRHSDLDHVNRMIDGVRILKLLKPDHREAVVLTKYAGMTALEAANWLGISESAIKSRLRRGMHTLYTQLEDET